jgi:hypothetical protein
MRVGWSVAILAVKVQWHSLHTALEPKASVARYCRGTHYPSTGTCKGTVASELRDVVAPVPGEVGSRD